MSLSVLYLLDLLCPVVHHVAAQLAQTGFSLAMAARAVAGKQRHLLNRQAFDGLAAIAQILVRTKACKYFLKREKMSHFQMNFQYEY